VGDGVEGVQVRDKHDLFPISACFHLGEIEHVRAHAASGVFEVGTSRFGGGGEV
jgi:hypothetical protein